MDCQLDAAVGQLSFGRAPSLHDVLLPHGWLLQQKWRLRVWSDPELHYRQAAGRADNGSEWHYGKRGSFERNGQPQRSKRAVPVPVEHRSDAGHQPANLMQRARVRLSDVDGELD